MNSELLEPANSDVAADGLLTVRSCSLRGRSPLTETTGYIGGDSIGR